MKKAFMRGVCALNIEAMAMFNEDERKTRDQIVFITLHLMIKLRLMLVSRISFVGTHMQ